MKKRYLLLSLITLTLSCKDPSPDRSGWTNYAGHKDGNRYSTNEEINLENVGDLHVAWTYSTSDKDTANRSQNLCNPIVVDGILYGTSPRLKLFAIDAATGREKWLFDPASVDSSAKNDPMA